MNWKRSLNHQMLELQYVFDRWHINVCRKIGSARFQLNRVWFETVGSSQSLKNVDLFLLYLLLSFAVIQMRVLVSSWIIGSRVIESTQSPRFRRGWIFTIFGWEISLTNKRADLLPLIATITSTQFMFNVTAFRLVGMLATWTDW